MQGLERAGSRRSKRRRRGLHTLSGKRYRYSELLGVKVQGPLELRISGYRTVVCQDSARGHLEECRTLQVGLHGSDHARIHQDCVDSDCLCS